MIDLLGANQTVMIDFSSNDKATVNLEYLAKGNYILQLQKRTGEIYRLKIVKE
jgi:hypothetical protein